MPDRPFWPDLMRRDPAAAAAPVAHPTAREAKASAVAPLVAAFSAGQVVHTPRRYDRLADEAYCRNIVAYQCVRLIADAFASLQILAFRGDDEAPDHPLAALVRSPQPGRGAARFKQQWAGFHLLAGNSYVEAVRPGPRRPPRELHALRPDRVRVLPEVDGRVAAYRYETGGGRRDFPVDRISGQGDLLHCRDFHPLNDWYGMSATEAAAAWIDLDNAGADLNAALLQNGANPSTVFSFKGNADEVQLERARAKIIDKHAGLHRAGEPLVLGGDWTFQRMSHTLAEMQWTEGMRESARRTCGAWGVPHVLVVPGESTYANRENGQLELWEHCVLPFAGLMLGDLVPWLRWAFADDDLDLRIDRDAIAALAPRRREAREGAVKAWDAQLITRDEARRELDYGDAGVDGDRFKAAAPAQGQPPPPPVTVPGTTPGTQTAGRPSPFPEPMPGRPALRVVDGGKAAAPDLGVKKALPRALATAPLYVALPVTGNSALALAAWAEARGIPNVVPPAEMHCTVVYSRTPVPALELPESWYDEAIGPDTYGLALFGGALVLTFESWAATGFHEEAARLGASWDHPEYVPHVTLSYEPGEVRPDEPPPFGIRLGPAYAEALDLGEGEGEGEGVDGGKSADHHPRVPAGHPGAGRFVRPARSGGDGFVRYLRYGRQAEADGGEGDGAVLVARGGPGGPAKLSAAGGKAASDDDDNPRWDDLIDDEVLAAEVAPAVTDTLAALGRRVLDNVGFVPDFDLHDPRVAGFLEEFGGERIRGLVGSTTRDAIGRALADVTREGPTFPRLVDAIRDVFALASEERAELIARTETTRAAAFGTQAAMSQAGVERKEFLSSRDEWVRDSHAEMDGQVVAADEDFESPSGAKGQGPGLFGDPAEDIGCRCVVVPLPDEAAASRLSTKEARDVAWKAEADVLARHEADVRAAVLRGFQLQEMVAVSRLRRRMGK